MKAALAMLLAGCGTTTFIPNGDASDDGSASDAATSSDGSASDAGDPCASLRVQIANAAKMLQQCQFGGSGGQCMNTLMDVCCPFSTSSDNTTQFQAMVSQFKNMGCKANCTIMCSVPIHICGMDNTCK